MEGMESDVETVTSGGVADTIRDVTAKCVQGAAVNSSPAYVV